MPTKASRIIKVKRTAICAIILFSFFKPGTHSNNATPKPTGISAVGEVTSR